MDQETHLEQLMHYYIGAYEVVPQLKDEKGSSYTQALLPYGSPLYTGILQATGYFLLKPKASICYISLHQDQEEVLVQKTGTFEPMLGQIYTITPVDAKHAQNTERTEIERNICRDQLGFLTLIQGTQNIHRLSIRASLTNKEKLDVCSFLKKQKGMNIIRLANLSSPNTNDQQNIRRRTKASKNIHHTSFQLFAQVNKTPHIIAYTGQDLPQKKTEKTDFTCIVA